MIQIKGGIEIKSPEIQTLSRTRLLLTHIKERSLNFPKVCLESFDGQERTCCVGC